MTQPDPPSHVETLVLHLAWDPQDPNLGIWLTGRRGKHSVTERFTFSAALEDIMLYASNRPAWFEHNNQDSITSVKVRFDNDTGDVVLQPRVGAALHFNPHDDEQMARLVRRLKAFAPIPPGTGQPTIPGLPIVTDEDLATKRTIYHNAMAADGVRRPRSRKVELAPNPHIREKLNGILDDILASRK